MSDEGPELSVEYIGPFERTEVVVNGWAVPLLQGHRTEYGERVMLTLNNGTGVDFPAVEAPRIVWFIAHCIAVAQGYQGHPESPEAELIPRKPESPHRMRRLFQ